MEKINFELVEKDLKKIMEEVKEAMLKQFQKEGPRYSIHQADLAGNKIGNAVDYLYDSCGCSSILFRDKRSSFYKQYKNYLKNLPENKNDKWFEVTHFFYPHSGRQEYSLNEAVAEACCEYLNKNCGANCYVRSWED